MRALVPILLFKNHVRADDFTEDDFYLEHLLEAATEYALKYVGRSVDEIEIMGGGEVPTDFMQGVMLVAGHWYNNREGVGTGSFSEVPYTIQAIFAPYCKLV